jgi:hypothetical protein
LKKSQKISLTLLAVFALVVIGFLVMQPKEPSYQGRRLTEWMADLNGPPPARTQAEEAIRQMKATALPYIENILSKSLNPEPKRDFQRKFQNLMEAIYLRDQQAERTRWEANFRALDVFGADALPVLERLMGNPECKDEATVRLGQLDAVDILEKGTAPHNEILARVGAIGGLGLIPKRKAEAFDLLLPLTHDSDPRIAGGAAHALSQLQYEPETTISRLSELLQSNERSVRWSAAYSLRTFGTNAASAIPILQQMDVGGSQDLKKVADETIKLISPVQTP